MGVFALGVLAVVFVVLISNNAQSIQENDVTTDIN